MCKGNCKCDTPEVLIYDQADECVCIFEGNPDFCICVSSEQRERDNVNIRKYQDKEWLTSELKAKSAKQISKEQRVSYKLINLYAIQHGLIMRTADIRTP